jgi:hypothetical protein
MNYVKLDQTFGWWVVRDRCSRLFSAMEVFQNLASRDDGASHADKILTDLQRTAALDQ